MFRKQSDRGRQNTPSTANMAAADWEEIKRLAADFQRAQLSSTVQR